MINLNIISCILIALIAIASVYNEIKYIVDKHYESRAKFKDQIKEIQVALNNENNKYNFTTDEVLQDGLISTNFKVTYIKYLEFKNLLDITSSHRLNSIFVFTRCIDINDINFIVHTFNKARKE